MKPDITPQHHHRLTWSILEHVHHGKGGVRGGNPPGFFLKPRRVKGGPGGNPPGFFFLLTLVYTLHWLSETQHRNQQRFFRPPRPLRVVIVALHELR
jgi:hypothetical protein